MILTDDRRVVTSGEPQRIIKFKLTKKYAQTQIRLRESKLSNWDAFGIIAELGNRFGFETYVSDPSRTFRGKQLGEMASLKKIQEECSGFRHINRIDTIWSSDRPPFCFFEVE